MNKITGEVKIKNKIQGEVKGVKIYPTLEDITITPSNKRQTFNHPNSDGYNNVTVEEVKSESLSITPTKYIQTFEGIYGEIKVDAIQTETLNVTPSTEKQSFNGIFDEVNVNAIEIKLQEKTVEPTKEKQVISADNGYIGLSNVSIEAIKTEELSIAPTSQKQVFKGLYGKVEVGSINSEMTVSYEEPIGENRKAIWLQKGKNLYPVHFEIGGYYNTNVPNRAHDYTNFEIEVGKTYTFSTSLSETYMYHLVISSTKVPTNEVNSELALYDSGWTTGTHTFTATERGYLSIGIKEQNNKNIYVGWSIDEASQVTQINNNYWFQLEEGSEATEYKPYIEPKLYMLNENDEYIEVK